MDIDTAVEKFTEGYRSPHTRRTYATGISRFCDWCGNIASVNDLDPNRVREFAVALSNNGLSPRSIQAYTTGVMQFMKTVKRRGWADLSGDDYLRAKEDLAEWNQRNKVETLPRLPNEAVVTSTLTISHLRDSRDDRKKLYYLRQNALVETWASTGCRISDSAKLKRGDLNMRKMTATVRAGKGNRDRVIIWKDEKAWNAVLAYLAARDELAADFTVVGEETLFARHDLWAHGKQVIMPLSTNSMRIAHKKLCQEATMPYYNPHSLRHRAITSVVEQTGNMKAAQEYAGHKHMSTTEVYTHLATDTIIEIVRGGSNGKDETV